MSVHFHPTTEHTDAAPPAAPRRVPVAAAIATSLAGGILAALTLTLLVFPSATESVMTGSILLAFGLGWALMSVLTARYTAQPQSWTRVPAAYLGISGLGLLAWAPDNAALTAVNWAWPPVTFVLVVWMFRRMRRDLHGRGRWLVVPVLAVLVALTVGATVENIAEVITRSTYPAPGRLVAINGHRLHIDCQGHGSPTVLLFNGLGEISATWARVTAQVSRTTRVCAYDRAGQGWSDDVDRPQDGVTAARDLHALLAAAGETGPYVLAGHSTGGPYSLTYASQYPDQVAGMVLLDSSSPEQMKLPDYPTQYALMRRGLALLPSLVRIGLGPLLGSGSGLPGDAADRVRAMTSTARAARNGRDEIAIAPTVFRQAQALTSLHGRPLAVLTTSESLGTTGWRAAQVKLAGLSTAHTQRDVTSSHAGLVTDERPAADSARAIGEVVTAVRTGAPLH